ncbi:AAA family ATPase [Sorangium sp. So ce1389]|uniref:AAA family ATPase n=1 Tax=Sorangium sp. So ce1389 TaxID=3133336 RepID=UPI003F5DA087
MLRSLHLEGVGPADQLDLKLGERLNVLTGDNGLGKSFVLEVAWWALTGTWTDRPVLPQQGREESARISVEAEPGTRLHQFERKYDRVAQQWRDPFGRDMGRGVTNSPAGVAVASWVRGLVPVLHIRTNGACSVFDPYRNSSSVGSASYRPLSAPSLDPHPYLFEERQLWDGLAHEGRPVCNGLVQDWVTWQLEAADGDETHPFQLLCHVLEQLSHPEETMTPGKPVRLYLDDVRKFPTIELPYGTIPIVHASAGMKRILSLAYLITWSWSEHVQASRLIGWQPSDRIVVLMEEPETHLHPRWQRHIVPALLGVLGGLSPSMRPQVLLTTHSPLVLASMEPHFKPAKDKLFVFKLDGGDVSVRELPWAKCGDAIGWLTSPVFGLEQARSIEAERAIEAAEALMRGETGSLPEGLRDEEEIHRELVRLLPDQDRFWPRWIVRRERAGA